MNEYFEANKRSLFILAGLLFILAIVLYFILVRPLVNDYQGEVRKISDLKEEIAQLEARLESLDEETPDGFDVEQLILENKIPTERELDEYILAIQQLELHTESKIESITFAYDSSIETEPAPEEESEENDEDSDEADTDAEVDEEADEEADESDDSEEADEVNTPTLDAEFLSVLPENLYVMSISLEVTSPNFDEFLELIKLIEANERISIVTNLDFTKPTEEDIYFSDVPLEDIPFNVEIATFYYMED